MRWRAVQRHDKRASPIALTPQQAVSTLALGGLTLVPELAGTQETTHTPPKDSPAKQNYSFLYELLRCPIPIYHPR